MNKWIFKPAAVLLPIILVVSVYCSVPGEIILPENARYSAYPNGFVRLNTGTETGIDTAAVGEQTIWAELFGAVPIKAVQVSVVPERYVTVSGETIGVRLYSDGIMVVEVEKSGAARTSGVKKGDLITKINGKEVQSVEELSSYIGENQTNTLTLLRDAKEHTVELCGRQEGKKYTAGMWIRDSAAGIGTMSFCDPETKAFGALGHAICDADTGEIVPIKSGSVSDCRISAVKAGKSGEPGELVGSIASGVTGSILGNTELGLYGIMNDNIEGTTAPVATRFQVKEGAAELLCDVDGNGVKSYSIEIEQVSKSRAQGNKSMVIRVTDAKLLEQTGGIVQGMSGAPIMQNGRLVGAVTHVFINDPERGYAVFAQSMAEIADKITKNDKS